MKRILFILGGLVGVFIGLGFILPAVALFREQGHLPSGHSTLLLFGCLLAFGGLALAGMGLRRRTS